MIPSLPDILACACRYYHIEPEAILGKSHFQRISDVRNVVMYLLKHDAKMSVREIALCCGGRHHTTVLHNIFRATQRLEFDAERREELVELRKEIAGLVSRRAELRAKRGFVEVPETVFEKDHP